MSPPPPDLFVSCFPGLAGCWDLGSPQSAAGYSLCDPHYHPGKVPPDPTSELPSSDPEAQSPPAPMIYKLDVSGPGKDGVSVSFHQHAQPRMMGTFLKMGLQCSRLRGGLRLETSAGPHTSPRRPQSTRN